MRVFTDLPDVLTEAAAGPDIRRYLEGRGIKTIGTLALVAKDEKSFEDNIVAPLLAGWTNGVDVVKIEVAERPIATAVLLHAWTLARSSWNKAVAAASPVSAPSTGMATTGTSSGLATDSKVPKTLPPGKWAELVTYYNSIKVGTKTRSFPVKEVLGAESVVARLWHERHVSQLYTPLQLGEVLQHRSFTASGDINPLMKTNKKNNALSLDEDRQLVETEDPTWTPRSVLSVLDGISACRWALILTQYGEEEEIHAFAEFMQQRARSRPDRMEHMVAYWLSSMWKVAMAMRNGDGFGVATQAIMQDMETFHDYMNKEVTSIRPKLKQPPKIDPPDKSWIRPGKGGKAKGGMGSQHRPQPYNRQRWPSNEYNRWRSNNPHDDSSRWRSEVPATYQNWWDRNYK